ncbi:MAG: sugar ABC transporter ATP-binding protein [Gemmatimonadetes bacterium]|nr:sugar ABC transporter ATP-binding protein [Gemmatimonadota bacterium]MYF75114.1 sugar ABC transporter ATP-binding protein [Gemmatimonadota bacterium]MYK51803.1 sugar ABC transporter ATP-binding protein [Gemmatimonadota bacterium]
MSSIPKHPRFAMRGIRKTFGATIALDNVDFAVSASEIHALIGENGAGKSTLMKVLSGALQPDAGEMTVDGSPFAPANPLQARQQGVVMIYQELSLAPHLTVVENVLLGMEITRRGLLQKSDMHALVQNALTELDHADIDPHARVSTLTIAERQIVEIARALSVQCRVLVLDEPTSSLTRADADRLFRVMQRLKARNLAIVYISHFLEEIKEIADQFTVLRDGKKAGSGLVAQTPIPDIVHLMVGRQINDFFPRTKRTPGEPLLDLTGGGPLPHSASLVLHCGEVLGIGGLIGAGRTELLRAIFGLDPIRKGNITFAHNTIRATPAQRLAQGMGLLSEDRKEEGLAQSMSLTDNLTLSHLPRGIIFPKKLRAIAHQWISRLDIRTSGPAQSIADLSGGNQQKVALARLLYHDVDCLLLDEPTRGIDIASKADIYHLIDQLATQGKAILLVSSYLPELLGICDRIAVMYRGQLGPARPVDQCSEHSLMLEATGQEVAL